MTTEYLDPDANINTLWIAYDYSNIDDGIRQPTDPGIGDSVRATNADDNEEQIWGMENLSGTYSSITEIKIWIYGYITDASTPSASPTCRIKVGETYEDFQASGLQVTPGNVPEWSSVTFSGSWSQSNVDGLEVSIKAGNVAKNSDIYIGAMYAEITATEGASGENIYINVDDAHKQVATAYVNVDDAWKTVTDIYVNVDDAWKAV